MTEIRSYRRVFDLERRIYTIERVRLNPSGVPVRGFAYFLGVVSFSLLLARVPLLGAPLSGLPWFVADLVAPAALAGGLTLLRVDGRTFHQAAWALVSFWAAPRRTVALRAPLAGSPMVAAARPGVRPGWLGRVPEAVSLPRARSRARSDRPRTDRERPSTGRIATRVLLCEPVRRLRRGRVVTVEGRATLRIARDHAYVGR